MSSKTRACIVVIGLVLFAGLAFYATKPSEPTPATSNAQSTANNNAKQEDEIDDSNGQQPINQPQTTTYTKDDAKQHDTANDCWTIIDNVVYDITDYIARHPGGSNILSACGKDATAYFNGEKAGQAGGTNDHSNTARNRLSDYELGPLAN